MKCSLKREWDLFGGALVRTNACQYNSRFGLKTCEKSQRSNERLTPLPHSRTQSPSYARSTERDEGLWPNPYQTGI
jgi:hypothetical protein